MLIEIYEICLYAFQELRELADIKQSWLLYLHRMSQPKTAPDGLMMVATARCFKEQIIVFGSNGDWQSDHEDMAENPCTIAYYGDKKFRTLIVGMFICFCRSCKRHIKYKF